MLVINTRSKPDPLSSVPTNIAGVRTFDTGYTQRTANSADPARVGGARVGKFMHAQKRGYNRILLNWTTSLTAGVVLAKWLDR